MHSTEGGLAPIPPAAEAGSQGSGPLFRRRPAYSSAFSTDVLRRLAAIPPLDEITAEWAWGGSTGKGVKVAVIDSGIEAGHPGLPGPPVASYLRVMEGPDETLSYDTSPHADAYGHGTACAALIRNIAPECELYSVQVLGSRVGGKGVVFAAGLRWAIDNGMVSTHKRWDKWRIGRWAAATMFVCTVAVRA